MAARRQFTLSRLPSLFLTLQRNVEWWTTQRLLNSGERVGFTGSELVFQFYPGHGIQIQWLGTFGKLNGYWSGGKRYDARASALLDEIKTLSAAARRRPRVGVPVPVRRPAAAVGLLARPGHRPAGDGPQRHAPEPPGGRVPGRARRARHLPDRAAGRRADSRPAPAPTTCSTPACRTSRWPTASSSRSIGLYDFATLTGDPTAQSLFEDGDRAGRAEIGTFDTGAWSLYSRGAPITRESDLGYHKLLIDFLKALCGRTTAVEYCARRAALQRVPGHGRRSLQVAHAARSPRASAGTSASSSRRSRASR